MTIKIISVEQLSVLSSSFIQISIYALHTACAFLEGRTVFETIWASSASPRVAMSMSAEKAMNYPRTGVRKFIIPSRRRLTRKREREIYPNNLFDIVITENTRDHRKIRIWHLKSHGRPEDKIAKSDHWREHPRNASACRRLERKQLAQQAS